MDFRKRLEKAIDRGQRRSDARAQAEAEKALDEKQLRGLHTQYRLELSEHIEEGMRQLPQQLPGFRFPVRFRGHTDNAQSSSALRVL